MDPKISYDMGPAQKIDRQCARTYANTVSDWCSSIYIDMCLHQMYVHTSLLDNQAYVHTSLLDNSV